MCLCVQAWLKVNLVYEIMSYRTIQYPVSGISMYVRTADIIVQWRPMSITILLVGYSLIHNLSVAYFDNKHGRGRCEMHTKFEKENLK
jgi:hypothetical protein